MENLIIKQAETGEELLLVGKMIDEAAAEKGEVLARDRAWLARHYRDYFLAFEGDWVVGMVGYKIWPGQKPEIISLYVRPEKRGRGIGRRLVQECLKRIKDQGHLMAFALTTRIKLFQEAGFEKVDRGLFPEKIWEDCRFCPKNNGQPDRPECNDEAMRLIIK